jgi:hypothetical protein
VDDRKRKEPEEQEEEEEEKGEENWTNHAAWRHEGLMSVFVTRYEHQREKKKKKGERHAWNKNTVLLITV